MFSGSVAGLTCRVARFAISTVEVLIYLATFAAVGHASPLGVDLPIFQARYAGGPVAFRASWGAFDALPLMKVGEMVCRTVFDASSLVPEATSAARDALRTVGAPAGLAVVVARLACVIFGFVGANWTSS